MKNPTNLFLKQVFWIWIHWFRIRIYWFQIRIHWFQTRILHFMLNRNPDRVLMTKNWKKFTAEKKFLFFWSKIAIYLSLCLHKRLATVQEKPSLQPSKRTSSTFSFFVGHFCPHGFGSGSGFRIWSRTVYADLIETGSGSETLSKTLHPLQLILQLKCS